MDAGPSSLRTHHEPAGAGAAWLAIEVFDFAFEQQGISGGLLAYVELGGPALDKGEPTQWPIYEGLGIGMAWAVPGMVMFFRRDAPDPSFS